MFIDSLTANSPPSKKKKFTNILSEVTPFRHHLHPRGDGPDTDRSPGRPDPPHIPISAREFGGGGGFNSGEKVMETTLDIVHL